MPNSQIYSNIILKCNKEKKKEKQPEFEFKDQNWNKVLAISFFTHKIKNCPRVTNMCS